MDLLAALARRGGAMRLPDLDPGLRPRVTSAVRSGAVVVHPGKVLALPGTPLALIQAVALRGVLCDLSAALYWGMAVLVRPPLTWVAVPLQSSRRRLPGTAPLRRDLEPADIDARVPVTCPLRTVVDCLRHLPFRDALIVANSAVHRRLVAPDQLLTAARDMRGPGTRNARAVARNVDARCESMLETLLYLLLRELGVPFQMQVEIRGIGRVDAVIDGWLVVEADGFAFHNSRVDYREDRRRANALAARGYVLVRLSYEDLVHDDAQAARMLRRVLMQHVA